MDGIVLLAGKGTRVKSITPKGESKHSILINKKPVGWYSTNVLFKIGVKHLIFVVNKGQESLANQLGKSFNVEYSIVIQKNSNGTPMGILTGISKLKYVNKKFWVIFGDSFFNLNNNFIKEIKLAKIPTVIVQKKEKEDLKKSGVIELNKNGKIISIEEKPEEPKGEYSLRGLFFLDNSAKNKINSLSLSKRGEYEIVDLISLYLDESNLNYIEFKDFGVDMGTPNGIYKLTSFFNN